VSADDVALAREIAAQAGRLLVSLRSSYGSLDDPEVSRRLRTEADAAAHDHIAARLAAARPGDALLSEEGADDDVRLSRARVWIVDPLDGTWEYGQGRDDFAVHVALWESGALVAGALGLPSRDLVLDTASVPRVADALPTARPVRIVVSRSRTPVGIQDVVTRLAVALGRDVEVDTVGSAGAKTAEVIEGRADAYLHDAGLSEWDVAAPAAVAAAAGLTVCRLDGSPVQYNRRPPLVGDLLVGVPVVASALLDVLS